MWMQRRAKRRVLGEGWARKARIAFAYWFCVPNRETVSGCQVWLCMLAVLLDRRHSVQL